ncbi:MAG: hypothetical protein UY37_C0013G0002 [Candidatus Beckwithbacteria bacterium GW2011_GWC2_49_11]|nr:MAG: hypothetical protein UY37_C0013G0002 [Candidatus Beckwithbacteria bacterium GW2011_GWC2_49_11]
MANNRGGFNLRRWLVLTLLVVLVLTLTKWPDVVNKFTAELPSLSAVTPKSISAEDILGQINTDRTENKMLAVKRNEKLDKAALARLNRSDAGQRGQEQWLQL